jgi:hypothetical protein
MMRPVLEGKADELLATGDPATIDAFLDRGIAFLTALRSDEPSSELDTFIDETHRFLDADPVAGPDVHHGRLGEREEPPGEGAVPVGTAGGERTQAGH